MFDEVLGELAEIEDAGGIDGYTATVETSTGPLEADILLYGTPLAETLPLAREFAAAIETHLEVASRHLISDFLPMHNSGYLEEGEAPLSAETFMQKAGKPSVSIDLDGEIQFTFGNADLLWGHWMTVSIHPDGTVNTSISG